MSLARILLEPVRVERLEDVVVSLGVEVKHSVAVWALVIEACRPMGLMWHWGPMQNVSNLRCTRRRQASTRRTRPPVPPR